MTRGTLPVRDTWQRFGLRTRVTAAFAAGAALLSAALAVTTFLLVDHYLLDQQQESAAHETFADARLMLRDLAQGGPDLGHVLSSLTEAQGSAAYLYRDGVWYSASFSFGYGSGGTRPAGVTQAMLAMVGKGAPAHQRRTVMEQPVVTVGVPLPSVGADFFEVRSLGELSSALDVLGWVLAGCAIATTVGGAVLGRWASGRLVRPLADVAEVAAAISGGALERRLSQSGGPELASLAASFNEMVVALGERIKRDARFASDVSHELRSPLTTIQAGIDLLQSSSAELPPDPRHALDLLASEVNRFSAMVQDLLEISRFDSGAGLDLQELALDELVDGTVSAYTKGAVPVFLAPGAHDLWVMADRRRLQRVVVNLLDNAQAYAGGAVDVLVERRGDDALVVVEDAGPGVNGSERSAIFERFYRGSASGKRGASTGAGLGLALVSEHVRAHGGTVEVADRPAGGARFIVRLPLARPEAPVYEAPVPEAPVHEAPVHEAPVPDQAPPKPSLEAPGATPAPVPAGKGGQ